MLVQYLVMYVIYLVMYIRKPFDVYSKYCDNKDNSIYITRY